MTRTALVIQHVLFEDLGLLAPVLQQHGYDLDVREAGVDPTPALDERPDLVVVLGGPVGVGDLDRYPFLREEIDLLRDCAAEGVPVLGVCLGAQLLAAALGAEVTPSGRVEIGYGPLTLTEAGLRSPLRILADEPVLHWHGDRFAIPQQADRLAETPGFPEQAFAVGSRLLGLQFHLEADPARFERWLIGHAHELATHRIDPELLRRQARGAAGRVARLGRDVFAAWLSALPDDGAARRRDPGSTTEPRQRQRAPSSTTPVASPASLLNPRNRTPTE